MAFVHAHTIAIEKQASHDRECAALVDPAAIAVLAPSLSQQQRAAEALPCYRRLTEVAPLDATHWCNPGNCLCGLGREREALGELPQGDGLLSVHDAPVPHLLRSRAIAQPGDPIDPVLLVGFPRSGTTLLEQLLNAHTAPASFDEQPFRLRLVSRIGERHAPYPEALANPSEDDCRAPRSHFFADVRRVLPNFGARHAVDKNPLNLVRLPLVATLFPQAQVLLALRHPCDVVLSGCMRPPGWRSRNRRDARANRSPQPSPTWRLRSYPERRRAATCGTRGGDTCGRAVAVDGSSLKLHGDPETIAHFGGQQSTSGFLPLDHRRRHSTPELATAIGEPERSQ